MSLIVVPFDFSSTATKALDQALLIASVTKDVVEVLHVTNERVAKHYPKSWKYTSGDTSLLRFLVKEEIAKRIKKYELVDKTRFDVNVKESALVVPGIINHCLESRAALLVMGTHGHTELADKLFGINTSSIINHALFPVLAVPMHWKPVLPKTLVAAVEIDKLPELAKHVIFWSSEFHSELEVVYFSMAPEMDKLSALNVVTHIPNDAIKIVKQDLMLTLAQNLQRYMKRRKDSILAMFVHERKLLEKIFDGSITERAAGILNVPLLALPVVDVLKTYNERDNRTTAKRTGRKAQHKAESEKPFAAMVMTLTTTK